MSNKAFIAIPKSLFEDNNLSHQELDELIIVASTADDSTVQVMTGEPVSTLAKLIAVVTTSTEQLGSLLQADTESLEVLKEESEKLQQSLAKL